MSRGAYISALAHTGLLAWLFLGWGLTHDPLDFEVVEVNVVTGEEFEALARATSPNPVTEVPDTPVQPVVEDLPPEAPIEDIAPAIPAIPEQSDAPDTEAPPPEAPDLPVPPTEVLDTTPVPQPPVEAETALDRPSESPQPRPAPRVAPTPAPPPPPDAETTPDIQQAATPRDIETAEVQQEEQQASAPEEAAPEIVTEAETPSGAVETSLRPQSRPNRPAPEPEAPPTDISENADTSVVDDASVEAALEAALAAQPSPAPLGPGLTGSERETFRLSVRACWNVDPGAEWARVSVKVGFSLTRDGKVDGNVRLVGFEGGSEAQANTAFLVARRAILRCQGSGGYRLPAEKYDHWRDVEITFDPTSMRLR